MNRISFTSRQGACFSRIGRAGLAAGAFLLLVGSSVPAALGENGGGITPPNPPAPIAVPSGNTPFLMGHAIGTQGYLCLPLGSGASWTVDASRPQATLFVSIGTFSQQILTHFLSPDTNPMNAPNPLPFGSPTWESSLDSSEVWGNKLASIPAGSDLMTCPTSGAIPCLLLQAIGSVPGPNGFGIMTKTTYIQRLNTTGGAAPATGCALPTDVGSQVLVPYTADYYFYQAATKD